MRGVYVLYKFRGHARRKKELWNHFSLFQVWDNIRDEEIAELEGLFRHIYRCDTKANTLNRQRGFKKLKKLRQPLAKWTKSE